MEKLFKDRIEECMKILTDGCVLSYNLKIIDDDSVSWAGECRDNGLITLNLAYYRANPDYFMSETIGHEVSHLYCFRKYPNMKRYHGKEFKETMKVLGLDGSTHFKQNIEVVSKKGLDKRPYVYKCKCYSFNITETLHKKMILEGVPRVCRDCKGPAVFDYKRSVKL